MPALSYKMQPNLRERIIELQNENSLLRKTIERAHRLVAEGHIEEAGTLLIWTLEHTSTFVASRVAGVDPDEVL